MAFPEGFELGYVERRILSAMDAAGPLPAWSIAQVTGQSVRLVRAYLPQLRAVGLVRYGAGCWWLASWLTEPTDGPRLPERQQG